MQFSELLEGIVNTELGEKAGLRGTTEDMEIMLKLRNYDCKRKLKMGEEQW